jgi:hypothetical protein
VRVTGGIQVRADGLIHPTYTREASTLRFTSRRPNLFNLPRPDADPEALENLVRGMFVTPDGWEFFARDYAGIEAVLVGVEAGSARYTRLARLGVHDYFLAHGILKPERLIAATDLPDLAWSDDDLVACFQALKKKFKAPRDVAKRCVHLSNYLGTPSKMHEEYPKTFTTRKDAGLRQRAYFELFPEIPQWHERICKQVDKTTVARNAFGYVHRFYRVLDWQYDKSQREWVWSWGDDAKRLAAFLPQSNAAGVISEAILALRAQEPEVADTLRVPTYDELLGITRVKDVERHLEILGRVMEAPVKQIPLPDEWGMGEFLTIKTEGKHGTVWGEMK